MLISERKIAFSTMNVMLVLLAGLFCLEFLYALESPDYAEPQLSANTSLVNGLRANAFTEPSQSALSTWRDVLLGRPLFDPSRRPPLAPSQTAALPVAIPRLSGIMITPTEKIAVLAPVIGDAIIVSENSHFGPFTVLTITGDSVTVKGPNGVSVLRSDFSYQGKSEKSTPYETILPGGIDLGLIKVALPSATTWPGPPPIH